MIVFFFFQAEDGIRDLTVTGVQTCALPISLHANYANSRFKREATCAFTLNFWQRYASHATAAEDACIANEGHGDCSVAKLCFPIGKIILPVTSACKSCKSELRQSTSSDVWSIGWPEEQS